MKLFHGNKKYGMDARPKEIRTLGGDKGWWTEIATTILFAHAAKIHRYEMDNNVWQRVVIIGNTVYGLNRPFVYPKIFEYGAFGMVV